MAITDQDHFLSDDTFLEVASNANEHYAPGKFVPFIGYEWSSRLFGHRNVIFKGDKGVLARRHKDAKPYEPPYAMEERNGFEQLCKKLKDFDGDAMLLPHHPSMTSMGAFDWSVFDSTLEAAAEIYSLWGSSECKGAPARSRINDQRSGSYYQDALARGYCLGVIGSGEAGDGHPGNTQWRRNYADKAGLAMTPYGGGLAAVWAPELTRESLFDAIKARRCYGTTNARIGLKFKANDKWMGERIKVSQKQLKTGLAVHLDIQVKAESRIEGIYIWRNGRVVKYINGYAEQMHSEYDEVLKTKDCLTADGNLFAYYYVRTNQAEGHMAWSSPVWFYVESSL